MNTRIDVRAGTRYGRWLVLADRVGFGPLFCRCDCGTERQVPLAYLRQGNNRSCGCLRQENSRALCQQKRTHGRTLTREYRIWVLMRDRCRTPTHRSFRYYGGKGVRVCDRWNRDFMAFFADMGPRPSPAHQLDRINGDGNYEPGNVRWATMLEQSRNKRNNRWIEYDGERLLASQWAERLRVPEHRIKDRLRRGWSVEMALIAPVRVRKSAHPKREVE